MIGGVIEIAEEDRHLSLFRGFLKVSQGGAEIGRVPLADISCVLLSAHQITLTKSLISALLAEKAIIVTCGKNWHPEGMVVPISGHHQSAGILKSQVGLAPAKQKKLWQQLVKCKISNQARILDRCHGDQQIVQQLTQLVKTVKAGDSNNVEAQAARLYWTALMGPDFRRDRYQLGRNAALNYGYAIIRAATARAVISAGLTPAWGLHHQNQNNPFALVDDLMEPFRPLVDWQIHQLGPDLTEITPAIKKQLVKLLQLDLPGEKGYSPLINCLQILAVSLVGCVQDMRNSLRLPGFPEADDLF